jgi:beta-lactam-binding protein with PASTA domain
MDLQRVLSGRYLIVSHLARGGMADVFVGRDQLLNRPVAIKVLHPQFAANEAFVERFRREAQAAANLSHPNVVAIYDWGRDQDTYFIIMELVAGRNLRDVLRSEGALDPRRAAALAIHVAAALAAAHERGLVHRDIKPANVLLTPEGSVKVTDFGIARAWDDSDQLTRTGAVIGTATYFSPEQAQGLTADARSDIYALGVVLYELLTGVPPFTGESPVSVAYQHVREQAPLPSDFNPNIPESLDAVVMRCLEKDPRRRYPTAVALAADLKKFLSGQIPSAIPPSEAQTRLIPATIGGGPQPPMPTAPGGYRHPGYNDPGRPDRNTVVIGALVAVALLGLGLILLFKLVLSGGSGTPTIPELRGRIPTEATAELEGLGFKVEEQQVADPEIADGLVAGTDPPAGQQAERGSTVKLLISAGPVADIEVPDVVDSLLDRARILIEGANLVVGEVTYQPSETIPKDTVISQSPEAGKMAPAGTPVAMVVSAGVDALTVPDVANLSEESALVKLAEAGFTLDQVRVERKPSGDVLEGFVIETIPGAGQTLPSDGTLTLVISQGAVPTDVPSVVGQGPEDARARLEELGFVVTFGDPVPLDFDDPNNGKVAEQSPAGGVTADYGSTVTLQVGESAEAIPVPNVIGNNPATAKAAIEAKGLVYARGGDILYPAGDPNIGKVAEVSPGVGTNANLGDTVTVRVGAEGVRVPELFTVSLGACTTAMTPLEARAAIESLGFVYSQTSTIDDIAPGQPCDGRAIEQSPPPGTLAPAGSTVYVTIDMPQVPDVMGRDQATAYSLLEAVGLVAVDACTPGGPVTGQDPAASTPVAGGSNVSLTYAGCP